MDSRTARRTAAASLSVLALAGAGADTASAAPAQADLIVTRVSYGLLGTTYGGDGQENVVGAGATLRIAARTKNAGTASAGGSTTRWAVQDSDGSTAQWPLRAGHSVGALAPGGSAAVTKDVVVPANTRPGTYRLMACADGSKRIRERSERNNCRTAARTFRVRRNSRSAVFIGGGAATGAFMEGGDPAPLAPGLTVTDADDTQLTGAMLGNFDPEVTLLHGTGAQDWFFFVEQLGITGTYNSDTGVLTLRGTASVSDYQTALRSVWYQFRGDDPEGTRKLTVRVRDAVGVWSKAVRQTITITPVNDAPLGFTGTDTFTYAVGSGPKPIDPGIALLDPDSQLAGGTVAIGSGFESGDDLVFANQRGITGTYDSGTGVLTLTGTASVSDYQSALRSVSYSRSAPPGNGTRRFTFQVTDVQGAPSNVTNFDITFPRG